MKYYGKVGYSESVKIDPGIYQDVTTERTYRGDVFKNTRRREAGESINDNISINNQISIIADAYAYDHFFAICYIEWMGKLWKVMNVDVQRPRLILTIGGLYNGVAGSSNDS